MRYFIGRLACNLAGRGLSEIRRATLEMQVRLTSAGEQLAERREQAAVDLHWGRMLTYQCCECGGAFEVDWGEGQVRYDAQ